MICRLSGDDRPRPIEPRDRGAAVRHTRTVEAHTKQIFSKLDLDPGPQRSQVRILSGALAASSQSGVEDARLTMPLPLEYQGHDAIGAFLRHREELRGRPLRVVPTRPNTQPAFGCYLPDTQTAIAHAHALFVLTIEGD